MYASMSMTGGRYQERDMDLRYRFVQPEGRREDYFEFNIAEVVVERGEYGNFRQRTGEVTIFATEEQIERMRDELTRALAEAQAQREAQRIANQTLGRPEAGQTETIEQTQEVQA